MSADISTREGLFAVMRQIAAERESAKPLVAELLARDEVPWDEEIPQEWRTAGFVEELTKRASRNPEENPPRYVEYLELAVAIALCLPMGEYPSLVVGRVVGDAFLKLGWLQAYQDRYGAAGRAYDSAEAQFENERALQHEYAQVAQVRANLLAFTQQHDEALNAVRETKRLFEEYQDSERIARLDLIKAMVHYCRGELHIARVELEELLDRISGTDDQHTLATLYNNLAAVHAQLGNKSEAGRLASRARELYAELGMPGDKPDWIDARALLNTGSAEEAELVLRRIRQTFLLRSMPEEAALAGLDIVDALIIGNRVDEARELTEQVIIEFREAKLNERALTALAYLRDLLPTSKKPREVVSHVRSYVESGRFYPAQVFVPLPEDD